MRGGYVVAGGTPEEVAQVEGSFTGQCLRRILGNCYTQKRQAEGWSPPPALSFLLVANLSRRYSLLTQHS